MRGGIQYSKDTGEILGTVSPEIADLTLFPETVGQVIVDSIEDIDVGTTKIDLLTLSVVPK